MNLSIVRMSRQINISTGIHRQAWRLLFLHCLPLCALLSFTSTNAAHAQSTPLQHYDYRKIGLSISVPAHWLHDGLTTTTKAEFIKKFGWHYDKPDANDIWNAVGSFSSIEVDSTRLPSDDAYSMHRLTIFVNRANTLYKQWLCRFGRANLWQAKPLINEANTLTSERKIGPFEQPAGIARGFGKSYEYTSNEPGLPTLGHTFYFVHQERCFEINIESSTTEAATNESLHQDILNKISLVPY
ncbi:MAG: hypothetical protein AB8G77_26300 [Rhodothermales bacterium]